MARLRLDDTEASAVARLRTALTAVLPLDDERRAICAVWLDFAAQAMVNADMAELIRTMYGHGCRRLVGILQAAVDAGEIDAALDLELQAEILTSFAVGLAREALVNPEHLTSERQLAMVDAVLARLAPCPIAKVEDGAA